MPQTASLVFPVLPASIIHAPSSPRLTAETDQRIGALNRRKAGLPNLHSLGEDLVLATWFQRALWPLLPLLTFAGFVLIYACRLYPLLPLLFVAHFMVSVTFTHDVLHGAAGFKPRATEWCLFAMSLLLLGSGHAFRQAHLYHHSHCLEDDDFEGSPARMSFWGALAAGPLYIPRHGLHAYRLAKSQAQKRWILAEFSAAVVLLIAAVSLLSWSAAPLTYCVFMWLGACLYPITTAWLPHFKPNANILGQARSLRGKIIPALLCNLSYHLEHHLYPQVPSYKLPQLAARLDPHFARLGVAIVKVV